MQCTPALRTARQPGPRGIAWERTSIACHTGCRSPLRVRGGRPVLARQACGILGCRRTGSPQEPAGRSVIAAAGSPLRYGRYRDNPCPKAAACTGRGRSAASSSHRSIRKIAPGAVLVDCVCGATVSGACAADVAVTGDDCPIASVLSARHGPSRYRAGGGPGRRSEATQPGLVQPLPRSVGAHLVEGTVDESNQVGVLLA